MYNTEGWCGPSGFPAREDDLSVMERGEMPTNKHSVFFVGFLSVIDPLVY